MPIEVSGCHAIFRGDDIADHADVTQAVHFDIFVRRDPDYVDGELKKQLDLLVPREHMNGTRVWKNKYDIRISCKNWAAFKAILATLKTM